MGRHWWRYQAAAQSCAWHGEEARGRRLTGFSRRRKGPILAPGVHAATRYMSAQWAIAAMRHGPVPPGWGAASQRPKSRQGSPVAVTVQRSVTTTCPQPAVWEW